MISFQFISLFTVCSAEDPWDGNSCGTMACPAPGLDGPCQYGLENVYQNPEDPSNSCWMCCQKGFKNTFDDCKCLPGGHECTSTASAQDAAYDDYKALGYSEADAQAAAETYFCVASWFWLPSLGIPEDIIPVFKCCESVDASHQCSCPPKDDTKRCYSKWSNPFLPYCDFQKSKSGEYCCMDEFTGECIEDASPEGFTDWAGCWGSSQEECEEKATKTRIHGMPQKVASSGCVYDVEPMQKYCGLEVSDPSGCEDARPKDPFSQGRVSNFCGLSTVSDMEWFVNRRLDAAGEELKFRSEQGMKHNVGFIGSWWIDHQHPKSLLV